VSWRSKLPLLSSAAARFFSVEIPEGYNSAKARRSDVVPNDDWESKRKYFKVKLG